jgi:hypothetical protein
MFEVGDGIEVTWDLIKEKYARPEKYPAPILVAHHPHYGDHLKNIQIPIYAIRTFENNRGGG